jgi:hypothetical protein
MTGVFCIQTNRFLCHLPVPVNPVIDPSLRTALQVRINHAVPSKLRNKENMQQTQVREEDGEMPGGKQWNRKLRDITFYCSTE